MSALSKKRQAERRRELSLSADEINRLRKTQDSARRHLAKLDARTLDTIAATAKPSGARPQELRARREPPAP